MPDARADHSANALLRVSEGLDLVVISADEVLVQFGSRSRPSELLRDTSAAGFLGTVVTRLLSAPATADTLVEGLPPDAQADVRQMLADLTARGVLSSVDADPLSQHLLYVFGAPSSERALGGATVTLVGAGPLGARLADDLVRQGVGRLLLWDDRPTDAVWHRFVGDGRPDRPAAAQDALARTLPPSRTDVETIRADSRVDGLVAAAGRSQLVLVAMEQLDIRLAHEVNRACLAADTPWLHTQIDGCHGIVGPLVVPGHTACYNDYRVLADAATPSRDMARRYRRHVLGRDTGAFFPGLPGYVGVVGGLAGLAAVHFLVRGTSFAVGRCLMVDFERLDIEVEDVLRLPRCPVCSRADPARPPVYSAEIVTRVAASPD